MAEETVSLRRTVMWGTIAFGIALAVVIGIRLEQAALAVVVGLACGVGASIPTSLLIVALLSKRNEKRQERKRERVPTPPPVVVVTPPAALQAGQPGAWPDANGLPVPSPRQFSVIGEEETKEL
jgi:hypothetical protein